MEERAQCTKTCSLSKDTYPKCVYLLRQDVYLTNQLSNNCSDPSSHGDVECVQVHLVSKQLPPTGLQVRYLSFTIICCTWDVPYLTYLVRWNADVSLDSHLERVYQLPASWILRCLNEAQEDNPRTKLTECGSASSNCPSHLSPCAVYKFNSTALVHAIIAQCRSYRLKSR